MASKLVVVALAIVVATFFSGGRASAAGPSDPRRHTFADQLPPAPPVSGVRPQSSYSNWQWPGNGSYDSTEERLTIESTTTPGGPYFWAYQFFFNGGDGGYLGLQDNSFPSHTKIVLFSIWQANAAQGAQCGQFEEDGAGYTCRIDPYNWQPDREYAIALQRDGSDTGGSWWKATVTDTVTSVQQTVGRIRVPPAWGAAQGVGSFSEYFGPPLATCADLPRARARWKYPVANGGSVHISGHGQSFSPGECASRVTPLDGADRHLAPK